jgi:hypothetical protein
VYLHDSDLRWVEKSTTDSEQDPYCDQKRHSIAQSNVDSSRGTVTSVRCFVTCLLECHKLASKGEVEEEEGADKLSSSSDEMVLDGMASTPISRHGLEWLFHRHDVRWFVES